MNHIRSLYGRFFLRIMAVCFLLAGLLFVAAASIWAGNSQLSVCLILIAAAVLLLFSAILLAVFTRAARLRNSSENGQNEKRLSFLTDLLNDEHYLGYSRQELASEMLKTQAQMNSLQSQINPHFLYNTLESIRSKALLRDEEEIATMIETLARLFRYNISQRNTESSILDELENVKNYVRIQNYRFRDKFTLKLELDDLGELPENYMMPTLTLQPIVENAIHHGLEPKISPGTILIRGFLTQSKLILQIRDDGVGMSSDQLDTLRARLFQSDDLVPVQKEGEGGPAWGGNCFEKCPSAPTAVLWPCLWSGNHQCRRHWNADRVVYARTVGNEGQLSCGKSFLNFGILSSISAVMRRCGMCLCACIRMRLPFWWDGAAEDRSYPR